MNFRNDLALGGNLAVQAPVTDKSEASTRVNLTSKGTGSLQASLPLLHARLICPKSSLSLHPSDVRLKQCVAWCEFCC